MFFIGQIVPLDVAVFVGNEVLTHTVKLFDSPGEPLTVSFPPNHHSTLQYLLAVAFVRCDIIHAQLALSLRQARLCHWKLGHQ